MVSVVVGDNEQQSLADMEMAMNNKIPIIILTGSPMCTTLAKTLNAR